MARPKKAMFELAEVETPVANKKKIRRYYSRSMVQSFDYPAVDDKGAFKIKRNTMGQPIYDNEGNEQVISLFAKFTNLSERVSEGYLSYFDHDPNDESPQNVALGKVLESLAADRAVRIVDEDTYDKDQNPAMYTEKKRREMLEAENARLRGEVEKLKTPEELERRLAELTNPDR